MFTYDLIAAKGSGKPQLRYQKLEKAVSLITLLYFQRKAKNGQKEFWKGVVIEILPETQYRVFFTESQEID